MLHIRYVPSDLDLKYGLDDEPQLFVSYILDHYKPWYKRIWYAIQYVFKMQSRLTDFPFVETMIDAEDIPLLQGILSDFKTDHEAFWAELVRQSEEQRGTSNVEERIQS